MKLQASPPSSSPFTVAHRQRSHTYWGSALLILTCCLVSIGTGDLMPLVAIAQPLLLAQSNGTNYGLGLPKSASIGGGSRLVTKDDPEQALDTKSRRSPITIPSNPERGNSRFRPPNAGNRKSGKRLYQLTLITPEDGAKTASPQPTLYWYFDATFNQATHTDTSSLKVPTDFEGKLRITPDKEATPIFETDLKMVHGLSSFKLPIAVALKPSQTYLWQITVKDAQHKEIAVASGWVAYIPPEDALQKSLIRTVNPSDRNQIYAQSGYWFEAIDGYTRWLKINPKDLNARNARIEILKSGLATNTNLDIDTFIRLLNADTPKSSVQ